MNKRYILILTEEKIRTYWETNYFVSPLYDFVTEKDYKEIATDDYVSKLLKKLEANPDNDYEPMDLLVFSVINGSDLLSGQSEDLVRAIKKLQQNLENSYFKSYDFKTFLALTDENLYKDISSINRTVRESFSNHEVFNIKRLPINVMEDERLITNFKRNHLAKVSKIAQLFIGTKLPFNLELDSDRTRRLEIDEVNVNKKVILGEVEKYIYNECYGNISYNNIPSKLLALDFERELIDEKKVYKKAKYFPVSYGGVDRANKETDIELVDKYLTFGVYNKLFVDAISRIEHTNLEQFLDSKYIDTTMRGLLKYKLNEIKEKIDAKITAVQQEMKQIENELNSSHNFDIEISRSYRDVRKAKNIITTYYERKIILSRKDLFIKTLRMLKYKIENYFKENNMTVDEGDYQLLLRIKEMITSNSDIMGYMTDKVSEVKLKIDEDSEDRIEEIIIDAKKHISDRFFDYFKPELFLDLFDEIKVDIINQKDYFFMNREMSKHNQFSMNVELLSDLETMIKVSVES